SLVYDDRGRLAEITTGTGDEARSYAFAYQPDNTLDSITDASGAVMQFDHDAAGRITGLGLTGGRSIGFEHDANGNLIGLTTPAGERHRFDYSATGLVTAYTPPAVDGAGATRYSHDLDRRVTRISRPDGVNLDFDYNDNGRLIGIRAGSDNITIDVNPTSDHINAVTAADGGILRFEHDGPLLIASEWSGDISGRVEFDYGLRFEPVSVAVNGAVVNYAHDRDGLLTAAGELSLVRDADNGLIASTQLGNIDDLRSYNGFAELSAYSASHGATELYSASYSHDTQGHIIQKVEIIDSVSHTYYYSYNVNGWLAEVQTDGVVTESYNYDLNGNRTSVSNSAGAASASFDAQDRMLTQGATSYVYSPNGELASKTTGTQTSSYQYDVFGNLLRIDLPNGRNIEYVVDGLNRRIGRKVNGTLTQGWLYQDQLNPVAELNSNGDVVSRFVYGSRSNVPDYMVKEGVSYRIISDHLGSVRLVVNASDGSIAQRIDYDAYGRVLSDSNPGFQPFGFAGGLYDPDTGLVRFGVRDYDPDTGRWTAKDPLLFRGGTANLYGYVNNDPVNRIDPDGQLTAADLPGTVVVDGVIDLFDPNTGQNVSNPANAPVVPGVPNGNLTPIGPTLPIPLVPLDPGIDLTDIFNRFYRSPC
ncbi:MAG TPA: hypothetical protein ENI83_02410, partial [Gammaproteobacteria bacterium]|nr:hypothetical protein [Gammaproteobacteria bacterium]